MNNNIFLTEPMVEHRYLDNETRKEKSEFLRVPYEVDALAVKKAVSAGGTQFKELKDYATKKKKAKYIVITTNNREQGLLAISYLAALDNQERADEYKDACNSFLEDYGCYPEDMYEEAAAKWEESRYEIPIIKDNELMEGLQREGYMVPVTGNLFCDGTPTSPRKPYWLECKKEAVCIEVEQGPFGSNFAGICENLQYFKDNTKVYILNHVLNEYLNDPNYGAEDEFEIESREDLYNLLLNLQADEVTISFDIETSKDYYNHVFENIVHENNLKFANQFPKYEIVDCVVKMWNVDKCHILNNIVKYAIKDWDDTHSRILKEKDISFLHSFSKMDEKKREQDRMEQSLYGMKDVKQQIEEIVNGMKFQSERAKQGLKGATFHNVHMMLGAPGTAKTTMAKMMGQMMVNENLLPSNRFICVNAAELKGKYVGHSAPKTKKLIEDHDVIVIDEAYSLVPSGTSMDSFSDEVIAQLIVEMEEHATDKLIIFAGYGGKKVTSKNDRMKQFLDANPGIKSRINSTIYFDSYTPEEMVQITHTIGKNQSFTIDSTADELIYEHFSKRVKDVNFGNGREARSLVENAMVCAGSRVMKKKKRTKKDFTILTKADFKHAIERANNANQVQNVHMKKSVGFIV